MYYSNPNLTQDDIKDGLKRRILRIKEKKEEIAIWGHSTTEWVMEYWWDIKEKIVAILF